MSLRNVKNELVIVFNVLLYSQWDVMNELLLLYNGLLSSQWGVNKKPILYSGILLFEFLKAK